MNEINPAVNLAKKTNYLNKDITYLRNLQITEYDIKSAGFSVIKYKKLLPVEEIEILENLPKYERNVRIGLRIKKNPKIAEEINNTLETVRKAFVALNNINEHSILSIKKDAIFIIKQKAEIQKIKNFEFAKKNTYTSYAYLSGKEFYYNSYLDILDCKGFSKEALEMSGECIKHLKRLFKQGEISSQENLISLIQRFAKQYLNRELDLEYYRELETGMFRVNGFLIKEIGEDMKSYLDISQNYLKFFLPLLKEMI